MPRAMCCRFTTTALAAFLILSACLSHNCAGGYQRFTPLARHPPSLKRQGPFDAVYKQGDTVTIPCQASGSPSPSYRWTKDNRSLEEKEEEEEEEAGDGRYSIAAGDGGGGGDLTIRDASEADGGAFRCYASNRHGVAVTVKTQLRMAVLDPFPSVHEPTRHRIQIGRPLTLNCHPPPSFPPPVVYWVEGRKQTKLKVIESTDRISLDPTGNLHFSNVLPEDYLDGLTYVCVAYNTILRSLVQGEDQIIEPQNATGQLRHEAPILVYSSSIPQLGLKGQTMRLRCIFTGLPTPRVVWRRSGSRMSDKVKFLSYGQELVFPAVEFDDAGRYHCDGTNSAGNSTKEIIMIVESQPYWRNGHAPDDVIASEEDDVIVGCHVNGVPKPAVTWLINGIPVEDFPENNRRTVGNDFLRIDNLTESDTQVVQCNASNSHGYLLANVFVSVQAEPPSFVEAPQREVRLSVGQSVVLRCRAFGAPRPSIEWRRGRQMEEEEEVVSADEDRFQVMESGDLSIKNASGADENVYFCRISNKFGSDDVSTTLLVRDRTVIANDHLDDQTVVEGTDSVVFVCNASTDPAEKKSLKVEWTKDGAALLPPPEQGDSRRMTADDQGQRLTIRDVRVADTGRYTCRASNGLDTDSRTVQLTVKGPPDPPSDVHLTSGCYSELAELSWSPGKDNNDPTTEYIVYFNTGHNDDDDDDDPDGYEEGARLNASASNRRRRPSVTVQLRPWTSYTFAVVAVNGVGRSERSAPTLDRCETAPVPPHRHPRRVCTDSRNPGQLAIVWEPMLRTEHNGPDFHYLVTYRSLDSSTATATEVKRQVFDWRQSELVIEDQVGFREYEISVQAVNSVGMAHGTLEKFIGYSGEDEPLERPRNFKLIEESLNDTSAVFTWEPVKEDRKTIRGFFQGYQLRFWKSTDPSNVRTENMTINPWNPCRPVVVDEPGSIRSAADDQWSVAQTMTSEAVVEKLTNRLWPYSTVTAGVLVLGGTRHGRLSDTIEFQTPEGAPEVVPAFWVSERGSHHLKLSWSAPFEMNGVLRGYGIAYKEAPPAVDAWKQTYSTYPDVTYRKIHDLKSDTLYLVTIWAETTARRGQELTIEEATISEDVPDKPAIEVLDAGYDYVNVSWRSSADESPRSPGSDFVVEYRSLGSVDWKQSAKERQHSWMNITSLEPGEIYEFRVVSLNRKGDAMKSDILPAKVSPRHVAVVQSSRSRVWIALLVCMIVISAGAAVSVFVIRRKRGGIYPVYKREKLNAQDKRNDKEPLGEYIRTEGKTVARPKNRVSLESSSCQTQEEEEVTGSLGLCDDDEGSSTKFNNE